jgi:hypothetical protein
MPWLMESWLIRHLVTNTCLVLVSGSNEPRAKMTEPFGDGLTFIYGTAETLH